jgi:hypothetical protein
VLSERDRVRFYAIALGSLREVQACADLEGLDSLKPQLDVLGAHLYRLVHH